MGAEVNLLAVFAAVISSMVVGFVFYAKPVFGNQWSKLTGVNMDGNRGMFVPMAMTVVASFITAYVLASMAFFYNDYFLNNFLQDSLTTAFWLWLGLTATRFVVHDAFEGRNARLTTINILNEFATIMVMGLVIGLIGL